MKIVAIEPIGMSAHQVALFEEKFSDLGHQFICFPDRKEDSETLKQRMREADIVIVSNIRLDSEILSACPQLKMISVAFTGLDHIDMEYCNEQGIAVFNASGYATIAVSELVIGLALDLYRNISSFNYSTRQEGSRGNFLGRQIHGKTVGVIGVGAIGKQTAVALQSLGCKVVAWGRREDRELKDKGIVFLTLEELLTVSDIITLHLPLNQETENFISKERLALCKPSAIIINTARGKLIDLTALAQALRDKKISGAGIDVFEIEPPLPTDHPLLNAPNCIVTPHVGYATTEAFEMRVDIVMSRVFDWLKTRDNC